MDLKDTLVRPIVTEKSTSGLGNPRTYAFEVSLAAGKNDVARAIESFYSVKVESVRTLIVRGKTKRTGRFVGKRSGWKKAYVTLAEGHALNLFETRQG